MSSKIIIKNSITEHTKQMDFKNTAVRNVYLGAAQGTFLKKDRVSQKFITGYENIPREVKGKPSSEIVERDELERIIGCNFDDPEDAFLLNLYVPLAHIDGSDPVLDMDDPYDRLKYKALVDGGIVAPDEEHLKDPAYYKAQYYFYNPKKKVDIQKTLKKMKNKIGSKLAFFEENKIALMALCVKLGVPFDMNYTEDLLYTALDDYKDAITTRKQADEVLELFESNNVELEKALLFYVAEKYRLYDISPDKEYSLNGVRLGNSLYEVRDNLESMAFVDSFAHLRELVYKKFKLG